MSETLNLGAQRRAFAIKSGAVNKDALTVELTFSSEEPVERSSAIFALLLKE
jgi:hypothetical protein